MSNGQQILNSEEVEFLLDGSGGNAKQENASNASTQQAVTMRGDLDQMPLGDVFQTLGLTKMEGVLRVCNPVEQRLVYFRGGNLRIVVPPRLMMRRLGQCLLQAGVLTSDDLRAALAEQKRQPRALDEVLVERGCVTQEQIDDIIALQASEELFGLFTWRHGAFEFFKGPPQDESLQKRLDGCHEFEVNSLLLEVARRSDEWEGILSTLHNLDEVPVRSAAEPQHDLDDNQQAVLRAADGKHTWREIADLTVLSEFDCARTGKGLVEAGLLETASPRQMLELAERQLDQGHGKNALILAQALCDRPDERTIDVSRALAGILRGAGEPKMASAVLLEAAQMQADANEALKLAQEARALSPRDLATMSFLRTTMLAHLPADAPELQQVTIDLLDGLLADGDVDRLFAVVDETKQLGMCTPQVMVREARGLAKKKEKDAAIEVMLRAASAFEQQGDRKQQLELLEVAFRLDRERKDIQRMIQALRSTPRTRMIRIASAAAAAVVLVASGVVWWNSSANAEQLASECMRIRGLLESGKLEEASTTLTALVETHGASEDLASLRQAVRAAESERAHALLETSKKKVAALMQQAGDLVAQGELAHAFAVYAQVRANADLAEEADSACAARLEALQRDLTNSVVKLPDLLPPPPTDLMDRQKLEESLTSLRRAMPTQLLAAARAVLRQRDANALPTGADAKRIAAIVQAAERAAPSLERGAELLAAYEAASQRSAEQRRMDPVFKEALDKERELDFEGALAAYRKLAATDANTEGLANHFRRKVTELEGILGVCEGIRAATQRGDHATAQRELDALSRAFPSIPFHQVVRLPVRLSSSMPGASVRWNGVPSGETPQLASYAPNASNLVELELEGFLPVRMTLPERHGGSVEALLTLRPAAEASLAAPIDQPMASTAERTFASDRDGAVVAFDNRTAAQAWRTTNEGATTSRTPPTLYQGLVITASADGPLLAQDQSNGATRWQRADLATEIQPIALDGRIAVSVGSSQIVLLDPRDGRDLGVWRLPCAAQGEIVGDAKTLVAAMSDGSIAALDVKSMTTRWTTETGEFGAILTMTTQGLVALSDDGGVALLDLGTGAKRWRRDLRGTPIGRPAANADACAITFDEHVCVLALKDGSDAMHLDCPAGSWSGAATMLGDYVAVPTRSHETLVYSTDSAKPRYALASDRAHAVVGSRRTAVLHAAGKRIAAYRNLP
jgi:Domain of unknown function (DUF4388)/PQQ-like domain/PEGA domain